MRCVVRDGRAAFVGSQSLRKLELDARREIGVLVKDSKVVKGIAEVFEADWARTEAGEKQAKEEAKDKRDAKREKKDADDKEEAVAASA